jgi:hypothetical protein
VDILKPETEIAKLMDQTAKLGAEIAKIQHETHWHTLLGVAAWLCVAVVFARWFFH